MGSYMNLKPPKLGKNLITIDKPCSNRSNVCRRSWVRGSKYIVTPWPPLIPIAASLTRLGKITQTQIR